MILNSNRKANAFVQTLCLSNISHMSKHVLNASELPVCVNSARSIRNAKAHAAHCMVNWNLQVPVGPVRVELRVEQIPMFLKFRFHSPSHAHWNLRLESRGP